MNSNSRNWLLVIASSLFLGSATTISEIFLSNAIDHFLPEVNIVTKFRRPGSIIFLSTNQKVIQKIGPATREKINIKMMPSLIKAAALS